MQRRGIAAMQWQVSGAVLDYSRLKSQVWKSLQANFYQAVYLAPSGGPILSSPAKKESGKKDAAKGGGRAVRKRPACAFASQMPLIERERGSKTAPFTLSLPGARLGCVRHRRRTLYGVPGKLAPASVPCDPVSKPLAASL